LSRSDEVNAGSATEVLPSDAPLLKRGGLLMSASSDTIGLAAAIVLAIIVFSIASPYFFDLKNFYNIGRAVAVYGIVAAVSTIVLVSGGLDLSLSSVMALGGVVAAQVIGVIDSTPLAILAAVIAGTLAGLFNALLIVNVGINPLIATIGTQFAIRGAIFMWTGSVPLSLFGHSGFLAFGNGYMAGVPSAVLLLLAIFVVVWLVMRFTRFGSRVYALGGSETATALSGIPVARLRTIIYALSACSAAFAGALLASVNNAAYPNVGIGAELTILAAVILGGTALTGGRGTVVGTFLGVLLLGVLANGLNLLGARAEVQMFVQGVVLILAVTLDEFRRTRLGAL
jgi:ribose/xylose/arabinose/galactoside ABC-type transport system permease subunit